MTRGAPGRFGKKLLLELGEALQPFRFLGVSSILQYSSGEGIEYQGILTREWLQMGIRDSRKRCRKGIDHDHPGTLLDDGFPHLVGQEMAVDQQIRAGNDDHITAGEPLLPGPETDPALSRAAAAFPVW